MPYFIRDNLSFHYLDWPSSGKKSNRPGVPLVFQHGLGSDAKRVFTLIHPPAGIRLLGLDSRGHGRTTPLGDVNRLGFDSFADDVLALMDYLQVPQAILGGTSMGAGVALNFTLRYPGRVLGLVLLRPAWLDGPMHENAKMFGSIARRIREHGPSNGAERFKASATYLSILRESPDAANSLLELFSHPRAVETVVKLERLPQDAPNRNRADWGRISVPTLVLANRRDPIHPFEYGTLLAQKIPRAQLAELTPKSVSLDEYTSDLRRHLTDFLDRHFLSSTSSRRQLPS
jgi:pimeloyl-ACP methyl ester carboxylesterase